MKKIIIAIVLALTLIAVPCYAKSLVRMPTMKQIEKLCVSLRLDLDGDIHYIYYKHIKQFNESGVSIVYGRGLVKASHYDKDQILNYEAALKRYKEIKKAHD